MRHGKGTFAHGSRSDAGHSHPSLLHSCDGYIYDRPFIAAMCLPLSFTSFSRLISQLRRSCFLVQSWRLHCSYGTYLRTCGPTQLAADGHLLSASIFGGWYSDDWPGYGLPTHLGNPSAWGLGWAFLNGCDTAWLNDELNEPHRIARVLTASALCPPLSFVRGCDPC